jgi:hypothetical protein
MRSREITAALAIMDRLSFFPVYREEPKLSSDRSSLPARDFRSICDNLQSSTYQSTREWFDDVESVISSRESFFTDPNYLAMTRYIRRIFLRSCRRARVFTLQSWTDYVSHVRTKIALNMASGPSAVRQSASGLLPRISVQTDQSVLSEKEIQDFVRAAELLTEDDDHETMLRILNETENMPDLLGSNIVLDITRIRLSTVKKLQEFVRNTLSRRGIPYPE